MGTWLRRFGWFRGGGGATHDILDGSVHPDSVAGAAARGSLVYGNATPKWARLAIGVANRVLGSDGTDIVWRQIDTDDIANDAITPSKIDPTASWGVSGKKLVNFRTYTGDHYVICVASAGDSAFIAKINGAPVGAVVAYDTVTGQENSIKPGLSTYLGNLVLHNTTRGDSALIDSVDIGTNEITLTANAPGAWANNDDIQVNSLTALSGIAQKYFDLDMSGVLPASAAAVVLDVSVNDTGAANQTGRMHPFEAIGGDWFSKSAVQRNQVAGILNYRELTIGVVDRKICVMWAASGAATMTFALRCMGWYEEAAT